MKFYENVTCQDIVLLATHLLTFLACSVLVSYYDMDFIRDYECDSSSSEGREYADLDNSCKPANPKDKIDV